MKYIFCLSGDFIELGKEEILSLFDINHSKLLKSLLIADLSAKNKIKALSKRLALTKCIYRHLFECKINELIDMTKNYGWNSVYRDNFCLRINYFNNIKNNDKKSKQKTRTTSESKGDRSNPFIIVSEKNLAGHIWRSLDNPKVNLENPKTKIELFFIDNKVYCGLLIYTNNEDFESRKAHLRPFPHPSSLHPKIARALVNISEIKGNEILLDPFCGTGGFLIESGLMKIKSIGYDINKIMINGCKENLKYFKIKDIKIKNQNALHINDKFDYVATDMPYGLNSNVILKYYKNSWKKGRINKKIESKNFTKNLENFYLLFLKMLRKKLKKKAVIVFPDYVDYKNLLKLSKFKIDKEFEQYVHRSLRRKIVKIV